MHFCLHPSYRARRKHSPMRTRMFAALALGLLLSLSLGILSTGTAGPAPGPIAQNVGPAAGGSGTFAKLAEAVKPAVINVSVGGARERRMPMEPGPGRRGIGSGFLIDS